MVPQPMSIGTMENDVLPTSLLFSSHLGTLQLMITLLAYHFLVGNVHFHVKQSIKMVAKHYVVASSSEKLQKL